MEYHALPTDSPYELSHNPTHKQTSLGRDHSRWWSKQTQPRVFLFGFIFGLLLSLLLYESGVSSHSIASLPPPETCGTSPQQAMSLGCKFDVMSFAWLPARCFDSSLTAEFLALREWEWFEAADSGAANISQRGVDISSVAKGAHDQLLVTQEYHLYHCTYMWRKMHRAIQREQPLDGYIGSMGHTDHCEHVLVTSETPLYDTSTTIFLKYANCPFDGHHPEDAGWYRMIEGVQVNGFAHAHQHD